MESGKKRVRHEEIPNSDDEEEMQNINCSTSTTPIPATASRGSSRQQTPVEDNEVTESEDRIAPISSQEGAASRPSIEELQILRGMASGRHISGSSQAPLVRTAEPSRNVIPAVSTQEPLFHTDTPGTPNVELGPFREGVGRRTIINREASPNTRELDRDRNSGERQKGDRTNREVGELKRRFNEYKIHI